MATVIQYANDECWETLNLFAQTTKQPLRNFEPKSLENTSSFEGWGLNLVDNKKRSTLTDIITTNPVIHKNFCLIFLQSVISEILELSDQVFKDG